VPLVCSRWHDLMAAPSMWPVLDVTPREYGVYRLSRRHDTTNLDMWLRRTAGTRKLTLRASDVAAAIGRSSSCTAALQLMCMPAYVQGPVHTTSKWCPAAGREPHHMLKIRGMRRG
jgi:hypothetical protein